VTEGREGRSVRAGEYARGAGFCMLTDGRQPPAPLPQRSKCSCACWRSLCSPPWLCMDANAHEPRPRPQASALPLPRLSPGTRLPGTYSCVVAALPLMRVLQRFDAASADCLPPQMKMVQLSLALACLLAGADAFAPIPTKVPHHTHEEPDTHEVPHHTHESESPALSASPSPPPSAPVVIVPKFNEYKDVCVDLNEVTMWTTESTSDYGTAKECWEACQAHGEQNPGANPNPVPSHEFLDWTKVAGIGTQCICKTSCDCFDENIAPELLPEHLQYPGVHTTLALPDWKGCTAPIQPTCGAWVGGNNEDWFQIMIGPILSQQTFTYDSDLNYPSELTCPDVVDEFGCAEPAFKLICAGTCKYSGACTADVALAHLWTSSDCEGIIDAPPPEFGCTMFAGMKPVLEAEEYDPEDHGEFYCDGTAVKKEVEEAGLAAIISISDEICKDSLSQDSLSRARKLTDAPRMDASKAHKLAAAMLRSIKTTAHRLAQVRGLGQ